MDEIKQKMLTQDLRGTAFPIFIVVRDEKVYGIDSNYSEDSERQDRDFVDTSWLCDSCRELEYEDEEIPDECDDCDSECFVNYKIEKDVFQSRAGFFFTAEACNEHIENNRHHYGEGARSYAISAYHNSELKQVMEYLVGSENVEKLK